MTPEEMAVKLETILGSFEEGTTIDDVLRVLCCALCGVLQQGTARDVAKVLSFIAQFGLAEEEE